MARRTREVWQNLVKQFEKSGKTREEFAAERQIPVGRLQSWIYKLKREGAEDEAAILPVRVVASAAPAARRPDNASAPVEVLLVRFGAGATTDFIGEVISRLRRC
jgi:hypothetical protein